MASAVLAMSSRPMNSKQNIEIVLAAVSLIESAAEHGGAIYARDASRIKLQDTLLTRNTAVVGGGLLLHSHAAGALRCSQYARWHLVTSAAR